MDATLPTLLLAAVLFAATDVDDLFLLIAFFADPRNRPGAVVAGQFLGIGVLVGASLVLALVALVIPPAYVGLLGLVPIGLGLRALVALRASEDAGEEGEGAAVGRWRGILGVAAVTIANGGDNLGVYTPVFAVRTAGEIALIVAVFMAMTAFWCAAAGWLVGHRAWGRAIRRHARWITPLVLVGVGLFVIVDAGTLALLRAG
jgi:cadmium resistance protein CadD (predicted permease)